MATQEKSFSIYISKGNTWFFIVGIIFASFSLIVTMYALYERYTLHEGLWWRLLLLTLIGALSLIGLGIHLSNFLRQQGPELIFNEQGVTIHHLGLVSWNDIQSIHIEESRGRHRQFYLFVHLAYDSSWQPAQQKTFGISTFNDRKKIITIDCDYLKVSRKDLIDIYEALMMVVPRLHDIDHNELYKA